MINQSYPSYLNKKKIEKEGKILLKNGMGTDAPVEEAGGYIILFEWKDKNKENFGAK